MIRSAMAALALLALSDRVQAEVKITNIQARHGNLGPVRESLDAYPGDDIVFSYLISGVQTDVDGKIDVEIAVKVTDGNGKVLLETKAPIKQHLPFGGARVPGFANVSLGTGAAPGKYILTVLVNDHLREETASFERTITCLKPEFAIVRPRFFHDAQATSPASLTAIQGTLIHYRLATMGFDRGQKKIHQRLTVQFVDENGRELLPKPLVVEAASDDEEAVEKSEVVNFNGSFACNRPGNFKVRFTVRDLVNNKTASFEAPVKVLE